MFQLLFSLTTALFCSMCSPCSGDYGALHLLISSYCCSLARLCLTLYDPMDLQYARLPRPSPFPGVCSNSCLLNWWFHPTISSSVIPFSSRLQSFPASGCLMSQLFPSGGRSVGLSALASVLPMNIQHWCPLRWTGWISLQSRGLSKVFSSTHQL